jgi:hypothetical protein
VVVLADRGDRKNGTLCGDRFLADDVTTLATAVRPLAWLDTIGPIDSIGSIDLLRRRAA